jgi:hypothetical protein
MAKKTSKTVDEGAAQPSQGPSAPEIVAGDLPAAPFETDAPLPGDFKSLIGVAAEVVREEMDAHDRLRDRGPSEAPAPDLLVPPVIGGRVLHEIPDSATWRPEWSGAPHGDCKGAGKCGPCTLRREIRACIEQGLAEPAAPWQSPCGAVANEHEVTLARASVYEDMDLRALLVDAETGAHWGAESVKTSDVLPRLKRAEMHAAGVVATAAGE